MLNKIDEELSFARTALNLRSKRQEILAGNLANADTPNYKARDLDFNAALRSAMGAAGGPLQMARTSAMHIAGSGSAGMSDSDVKYRSAVQPSLDGNTVDPDVEKANFAENALHYQFLLERVNGQVQRMKQALGSDK